MFVDVLVSTTLWILSLRVKRSLYLF